MHEIVCLLLESGADPTLGPVKKYHEHRHPETKRVLDEALLKWASASSDKEVSN